MITSSDWDLKSEIKQTNILMRVTTCASFLHVTIFLCIELIHFKKVLLGARGLSAVLIDENRLRADGSASAKT